MIGNQVLDKLRDFQLNSYESKIWVALLTKGDATAGSLSESTDVPRSRCYDVLESLEKKGFIIMKVGRPITYMAVSPVDAIDRLKQRLQDDTNEKIKSIELLKQSDVIQKLNKLSAESIISQKPEEMTGLVRNKRNINNHLSSLFRDSSEILLSTDSKNLPLKKKLLQLATKNVKIRVLTDKEFNPKQMKIDNAIIKTVDNVGRFCVTDKGAALFLTGSQNEGESLVWLNSEYSVNTLRDLFNAKWNM